MKKYQKLITEQYLNNEEALIDALKIQYALAQKDINKKVKELQSTINSLQGLFEAEEDLSKQAIYKSMIQSKIYQKQYQMALKKQVSSILDNLHTEEFKTIDEYLRLCYEEGFVGALYELNQQDIPLIFPIDQQSMVRAVQLDSKIVEGYYQHLGVDVNTLKKKITAEISRGIATGRVYSEIAQQIDSIMQIGYNNAIRISRTEGNRINNQAAFDAAQNAKDAGCDVKKQWDSTLDGRTRHSHARLDGEIRELDEPFSNGLMKPSDPSGQASEVINCRCRMLQISSWDIDGKNSKMDNFAKQIVSFDNRKSYLEFKKDFFSDANMRYMNYVATLEERYNTKDFKTILNAMNDREYNHYSKLLKETPIYN